MHCIKLVVVEMQDHFLGTLVQIQVPGFVRVLIFFLNTLKNTKKCCFYNVKSGILRKLSLFC